MAVEIEALPRPKPSEAGRGRRRQAESATTQVRLDAGEQVAAKVQSATGAQPAEPADRDWWRGRQQFMNQDDLALMEAERDMPEED